VNSFALGCAVWAYKGWVGDFYITFAQLPPRYGPAHINDLTQFLTRLSQSGYATALEVRHPAWFREPYASNLTAILQQLGIGRVLLDSRPIYESPEPFLPEAVPSESTALSKSDRRIMRSIFNKCSNGKTFQYLHYLGRNSLSQPSSSNFFKS
jgi:uncharacterized protein YecE (DUF72 family)